METKSLGEGSDGGWYLLVDICNLFVLFLQIKADKVKRGGGGGGGSTP